jgi:hypothetical protein
MTMERNLDDYRTLAPDAPLATTYRVGEPWLVTTSALIGGDGVDLVVRRPGLPRAVSVQLTLDEARELSAALRHAADESERL